MFTDSAQITTYFTPDDPQVPDELVKLIDSAQSSVRFIIYGCTLVPFFDAIIRAKARGVTINGIFDHTQSCGPAEAAQLHRLFLAVDPRAFLIGTSEKLHQIVHLKGLWVDRLTVWSGSWNFSPSATSQVNHVDVIASAPRAAAFQASFDELATFIRANEPQYAIAP